MSLCDLSIYLQLNISVLLDTITFYNFHRVNKLLYSICNNKLDENIIYLFGNLTEILYKERSEKYILKKCLDLKINKTWKEFYDQFYTERIYLNFQQGNWDSYFILKGDLNHNEFKQFIKEIKIYRGINYYNNDKNQFILFNEDGWYDMNNSFKFKKYNVSNKEYIQRLEEKSGIGSINFFKTKYDKDSLYIGHLLLPMLTKLTVHSYLEFYERYTYRFSKSHLLYSFNEDKIDINLIPSDIIRIKYPKVYKILNSE